MNRPDPIQQQRQLSYNFCPKTAINIDAGLSPVFRLGISRAVDVSWGFPTQHWYELLKNTKKYLRKFWSLLSHNSPLELFKLASKAR